MCTVFGSGRSFTSASGLGQRMRHEQPVEPNERFAGIKRARWSDDELNQVAEIVYRHRKLINTKQTIAPLVPEKTVEVVKKACQRPKYLRLFNSFKSRDADRKARLVFLPKKSYRIDELKPDLVIVKQGVACVVDVTVSYDYPLVFKRATEEKARKYGVLTAKDISGLGGISSVEVIPIVLGSCGRWRHANSKFDKILGLPQSFAEANIIRVIKASLLILRLHISLQSRNSRSGNSNNALTLTSSTIRRSNRVVLCNKEIKGLNSESKNNPLLCSPFILPKK
ncbi:hypothetical protein QYM36_016734 [Artemia franciscana]|uniref:Uncharacterized protein n=1 Tax=Artemia franciscana TaxID=6661 RepID=A0AA88H8R2_ARTSF|nr:hypothetical protein QYM36_016734 [Artemia franciscana]